MEMNIGESDKVFRWAGGLAIIIVGIIAKSWWGLLGIIPIALAIWGFCPLYHVLGIRTNRFEQKN